MAKPTPVIVPELGDFADVPIIEILVAPGDRIEPETPLLTLESDKATMEVPSPIAGTVEDIAVKVGDIVSTGTTILHVKAAEGAAAQAAEQPAAAPEPAAEPQPEAEAAPAPAAEKPAAPPPPPRAPAGTRCPARL